MGTDSMRTWLVVACAPLIFCAGSGAPAAEAASQSQHSLPVFSFMGETTEVQTTRSELNGEKCTSEGDSLRCAAYLDAEVAGVKMGFLTMNFYKGRLNNVTGSFHDRDYPTVLRAFIEKYGPGNPAIEKWQAKSGASFDNAVTTWRFVGGELKLQSMGLSIGESLFIFVSTANAPPSERPKIDF